MLRIYGASDDLVEIEGSFVFRGEHHSNEGIGSFDSACELVIGAKDATSGSNAAGMRVTMEYGPSKTGVWEARVAPLDEDIPISWPVRITARGYTAVVEIDCPAGTVVTWVDDPTNKGEAA